MLLIADQQMKLKSHATTDVKKTRARRGRSTSLKTTTKKIISETSMTTKTFFFRATTAFAASLSRP
jgi:hypothetical protein